MSVYVMFASFEQSKKRAAGEKGGRVTGINRMLEEVGARVLMQYEQMAAYDLVNVIEVADERTMVEVEKALNVHDSMKSTRLMGPYPAISCQD